MTDSVGQAGCDRKPYSQESEMGTGKPLDRQEVAAVFCRGPGETSPSLPCLPGRKQGCSELAFQGSCTATEVLVENLTAAGHWGHLRDTVGHPKVTN